MNESLTNVPSGLKIALRRFQSTTGDTGFGGMVSGMTRGPGSATPGLNTQQGGVVIQGDVVVTGVEDLASFQKEMERKTSQAAVASAGPMASTGSSTHSSALSALKGAF